SSPIPAPSLSTPPAGGRTSQACWSLSAGQALSSWRNALRSLRRWMQQSWCIPAILHGPKKGYRQSSSLYGRLRNSPLPHENHCLGALLTCPAQHYHLHDNDSTTDSHLAVGKGTIDFTAVMAAVKKG